MKKSVFTTFLIFLLTLLVVSASDAANSRKTVMNKSFTPGELMLINAVKSIEFYNKYGHNDVGHALAQMAGTEDKVKWSIYKSEVYLDDVRTLMTFIKATVNGKDENGKSHTAEFIFWINAQLSHIQGPKFILDGKETFDVSRVITTGQLIPPSQPSEGDYRQ